MQPLFNYRNSHKQTAWIWVVVWVFFYYSPLNKTLHISSMSMPRCRIRTIMWKVQRRAPERHKLLIFKRSDIRYTSPMFYLTTWTIYVKYAKNVKVCTETKNSAIALYNIQLPGIANKTSPLQWKYL